MFQSATLRLTLWYLALILALSVFFSVLLYRALTIEITETLGRQERAYRALPPAIGMVFHDDELARLRREQLEESRQRILLQIIYANLLIVAAGGLASYALARRTLQPIEEAHQAQVRFTADASHELRTPLTAMKTEIEVALREPKLSKEQVKELLSSTVEEIDKLETLSTALLTLAHAEDKAIAISNCKVEEIIRDAALRVRRKAKKHNITVEEVPLNLQVHGECTTLVELVIILLDNAVKYSPEDSAIRVVTKAKNDQVEIAVHDEGQGIKASDVPHIFQRFYRADTSRTKQKTSGYGLGLSIAKQIVDRHNGTIDVVSVLGKGSTFTVTLPA
jgi:signal transduction histidine kinase